MSCVIEKNHVYIGSRYVAQWEGEHDINRDYENFSIVTKNNIGYISKKVVPTGIELTNAEYWVKIFDVTEVDNPDIIQLKQDVIRIDGKLVELTTGIETVASDLVNEVKGFEVEIDGLSDKLVTETNELSTEIINLQNDMIKKTDALKSVNDDQNIKIITNESNITDIEGRVKGIEKYAPVVYRTDWVDGDTDEFIIPLDGSSFYKIDIYTADYIIMDFAIYELSTRVNGNGTLVQSLTRGNVFGTVIEYLDVKLEPLSSVPGNKDFKLTIKLKESTTKHRTYINVEKMGGAN